MPGQTVYILWYTYQGTEHISGIFVSRLEAEIREHRLNFLLDYPTRIQEVTLL